MPTLTLSFCNKENIALKSYLAVEKMIPKGQKVATTVQKGKALYFSVPYVQTDILHAFFHFYIRDKMNQKQGNRMAIREELKDNKDLEMFDTCLDAFYNNKDDKGNISIHIDGIEPTERHSANKYIWTTQFDMILSFYIDYLHNLNGIQGDEGKPLLYHHTYGQLTMPNSKKDNEESGSSKSFALDDLEFKDYIEHDGHKYPTQLKTVMIELFSSSKAQLKEEDEAGPEWCQYFKLRGSNDEKKTGKKNEKNEKSLKVLEWEEMDAKKNSPVQYVYSMLSNLKEMLGHPTEEDESGTITTEDTISMGLDISMQMISNYIHGK